MQDHAHTSRLLAQRGDRLVVGRARVDHQRLAQLSGQRDVIGQRPALICDRRIVAVLIKARLADGHHLRVGGKGAEIIDHVGS